MTQRNNLTCQILFAKHPTIDVGLLRDAVAELIEKATLTGDADSFTVSSELAPHAMTARLVERKPGGRLDPLQEGDEAAVQAASAAAWALVLDERDGTGAHPMERAGMLISVLVALADQTDFVAAYSPQSGVLMTRAEVTEAPSGLLFSLRPVFFDGVSVTDTLGLDVLGLQDLQVAFGDLNPNAVAERLSHLAVEMITEGHEWGAQPDTIAGCEGDETWTIRSGKAFQGPDREVAEITCGRGKAVRMPR